MTVNKLAATGKITIDGKGDEPEWGGAGSTGPFVNVGTGKPDPSAPVGGSTKVLWDDANLYVLVEDETVLAHAFLFPLEAWFGGARVRIGGIATVGVAPEARGRGLGSRLVEHLHELSLERGDALTVLYPFRQAFYARLADVLFAEAHVPRADVIVSLVEVEKEDWSFGDGIAQYAPAPEAPERPA